MSADAKDVEAMSIKELKALITSAGLSTKDCVEKADLRRRAACASQARLAAGGGSTSPPGAAAPAAPSGPSPLGSCDTPSTLGGTAQQDAFAWLVELLGPLEGRARELRGGNRGKLDVMVLDLRVRRGADPTPDDRILADAHMFSRARPKSIVSHMDSLGFPKSFARPQVAIILSKCSFREEDTTVICCVGDKVPPRGGRPPPNFNHTFFSTCFDKLQGIRDRAAARLEEKMMSKGELDTPEQIAARARTRGDRHACGACGKVEEKMMSCAGCRQVRYCSPACQKQAWKAHKLDCKKYQKVAADVDATRRLMEESGSVWCQKKGKDVAKGLSGCGLDAMPSAEEMVAFQVKVKRFEKVLVQSGYLSRLVWEARCDKWWEIGGDSVDAVRRAGLAGTRQIGCMIKNGDFEDWCARTNESVERVGKSASGLAMEFFDASDIRHFKDVRPGLAVIEKAFRHPGFDPTHHFICGFLDPTYGPYADATICVPYELRFNLSDPGGLDDNGNRIDQSMRKRMIDAQTLTR